MRSVKRIMSSGLAGVIALSGLLLVSTGAEAGRIGEVSYSDSFGNLVIISPSGYKRIVVGQGDLADAGSGSVDNVDSASTTVACCARKVEVYRERSASKSSSDNWSGAATSTPR